MSSGVAPPPTVRPIRRIAIVNRGESALRCIRTAKSLATREGEVIETVALYTAVDRDAPFVRHADLSFELPSEGSAVSAYLDHEGLLEAITAVGADAVWPGWGFVSEDPVFVEKVTSIGVAFLGPSAEAMRALGDKIESKRLAEACGVPVTAWSERALEDEDDAARQAERIGYPLVVKAAAGGGGRGIRMVAKPFELKEAYRSAQAEAAAAFGDNRLFCESLVRDGRHIEVQIVADQHGHVHAVGCRDCSVQRRHQKVIEEAPPPGLDPKRREEMQAAAVRLAERAGYSGVGTVEFLVTADAFFFLEMNPRLQVEHGITEAITGLDLVELQIRIGRGESLEGLCFEERGVALEARVCAEDPDEGFLPSPGRIVVFDPALGPGLRLDSGVSVGTRIPADFDSLIAKVIATGGSREAARARLVCALRDFELVVQGGATNKGYLIHLLEAEAFRRGGVDTGWLDRWNEAEGSREASEGVGDALVAAAVLAYQQARSDVRTNFYVDTTRITDDRIPASEGQQIDLSFEGESYRLKVYAIGSWGYRVHLDGRVVNATMREEGVQSARLALAGRTRRILYDRTETSLWIEVDGHPHRFGWQTLGRVSVATPAMVVAIHAKVGDRVELGEPLGLLEAMKMEIAFQAPVSGVVREVLVRKGQQVAAGEILLEIDPGSRSESAPQSRERLALPLQRDPLALLFHSDAEGPLGAPDLAGAAAAGGEPINAALQTAREEIRRVLLGYDANPERGDSLVAFLDAALPDALPLHFLRRLAENYSELVAFADIEELFIRSPRASVSGELGPSNDARLRMYVRRMHAEGAGIAPEFLDLALRALAHYGVDSLVPGDGLERAVLRLLATQIEPGLRRRLVLAMLHRLIALADSDLDLGRNPELGSALHRISGMRGLLPDSIADAAIEAHYLIFERREFERQSAQGSRELEDWLARAEWQPTTPSANVLMEVAATARRVFDRVGRWIGAADKSRREIALAAHIQRVYAPSVPTNRRLFNQEGTPIQSTEYSGRGVVLASAAGGEEIAAVAGRLCTAADLLGPGEVGIHALELVVPEGAVESADHWNRELPAVLADHGLRCRFTLTFLVEDGNHVYRSFAGSDSGISKMVECADLHPEIAARIDLERFRAFDLERQPSDEGIYTFFGRSRDVPGDERIFVLADVQSHQAGEEHEAQAYLAAFERAFYQATRSLRSVLQVRDPRRRLHWNRVALFVAPEIYLDPEVALDLAKRLGPATRHLGLEKVIVRLRLLDRGAPEANAKATEIVISEAGGEQMQLASREPHHDALRPAKDYERQVVAARSRGLVYPYEIIRMLTRPEEGVASSDADALIPRGTFEEFDFDEGSGKAVSVLGRDYGRNQSGVVFGIISTPTGKVPEGMRRVLVLSDPNRGMGSLAVPECARLVAAIDLAEREKIPVEWIPVSSGAAIAMDSGTENLDATARVVRRIVTFTQAGGSIHVIVSGINVGAQSYFDSLSTMLMHTRGVLIMTQGGSMVLTGRAALQASGGVAAEDEIAIGGFERIMGPNGEGQYYARNLGEAFRILYEHYRFSFVVPGETRPRRFTTSDPSERSVCDHPLDPEDGFGFERIGEIFDDASNPGRKRPFAMRSVMKALIDQDGGSLERWRSMVGAETAICWDAHLGGIPVTLLGIESHTIPREGYRSFDGPEAWTGGTLFPLSSKKVARALNAASGVRPVVVLANLSGFDGSPESMRKLQLEYGAEIARAVVNFKGPLLFMVVSRYHGGAYVVFSQELNDGLRAMALTGSYASVIGGGPAAAVVFTREVRARSQADPRVVAAEARVRRERSRQAREALEETQAEVRLEAQAELAAEFDRIHSVERARDVGSLDRIFAPARMRAELIGWLEQDA